MRNAEWGMRNRCTSVRATDVLQFRIPRSECRILSLAVKHGRLFGAPWRSEAKMLVRGSRGAAAARRARQEAALHEKRLAHLLPRAGDLAHNPRDGGEPDGPAPQPLHGRLEGAGVHVVEAQLRP